MTAVPTTRSGQQVPVARVARSERIAALAQRHGALEVLLLSVLVASLVFDSFATFDNVTGFSIQSSFLIVLALGRTFVIITGGIGLSVGSVFALGGVVAAWAGQYGLVPALLAPLLVCGAVGSSTAWSSRTPGWRRSS